MLTLSRFTALVDSYGAELNRWPEAVRAEAQALAESSPQARALLAAARVLDATIATARASHDASLWPPGDQAAALARLRSGVAARIASSANPGPGWRRFGAALAGGGPVLPLQVRWVALV